MPSLPTLAAPILTAALLSASLVFAAHGIAAPPASTPVTEQNQHRKPVRSDQLRSALPAMPVDGRLHRYTSTRTSTASALRGALELQNELRSPHRAHGRVFFRRSGSNDLYSCSGTVVRSASQKIVYTAGHCVYDLELEEFHGDVTFVPGYRDGQAPFGLFGAESLSAPRGWVEQGDTDYDIGLIVLEEPIQRQTGGRMVSFGEPTRKLGRLLIYGYPVLPAPRYDGERPIVCDASFAGTVGTRHPPSLAAQPCDMEQGSSGGAWISRGYLVSVVSHGFCDARPAGCGYVIGPHFGKAALRLYRRAGGSEPVRIAFVKEPAANVAKAPIPVRLRVAGSTRLKLECRLDRMKWHRCRSKVRLRGLEPGRHVFRVRVTDQAGKRAQLGRAFTVKPRSSP